MSATATTVVRAAVYARISEDRDETQAGVQRQLQDCAELAAARDWQVYEEYVDNDISAWKGGKRPSYERLLQDIEDGHIGALVVYHQDRLHRHPRELEAFFDICDRAGLTNLASVSGDIDLATSDGRFKARILGSVAAKESDDKSRRIRRKMQELARNGEGNGGGTRPFGFEEDRVTVRPDEADVIRELAARLIAGDTLRSLAVDLNDRGILTTTGRPWSPTPLRRMLRSGRISGQREHHGEIVATATWPAIITPEQTARIRALLDDPSRRAVRAPQRYMLKGLLRCGQCGATLVARPRGDGARRYICARGPGFSGCGKTYVLAEPLEEFITEMVLVALDSPEMAQAVRGAQTATEGGWQREADAAEERLEELAGVYAAGDISLREWLAAREPLQRKLEDARRRLSRSTATGPAAAHLGQGEQLRGQWNTLGVERRHAIISALIAHVEVGPGRRGVNRFVADRFRPVWRY